jgi:hypothetical protein
MPPDRVGGMRRDSSDSKFRRRWSLKEHGAFVEGMGKLQLPGMEHVAGEGISPSVHRIPQDGTSEMFEMDSDLVGATGLGVAFEQTPTVR